MSSPWPAMPMTSVEKMRGAMSDLIIRRKMVERGFRSRAAAGNRATTTVPSTMATRIHWVSDRLRRKASMGGRGPEGPMGGSIRTGPGKASGPVKATQARVRARGASKGRALHPCWRRGLVRGLACARSLPAGRDRRSAGPRRGDRRRLGLDRVEDVPEQVRVDPVRRDQLDRLGIDAGLLLQHPDDLPDVV